LGLLCLAVTITADENDRNFVLFEITTIKNICRNITSWCFLNMAERSPYVLLLYFMIEFENYFIFKVQNDTDVKDADAGDDAVV